MDPVKLGYTEEGHCKGNPHPSLPGPQRLQWNIPAEVAYHRGFGLNYNVVGMFPFSKVIYCFQNYHQLMRISNAHTGLSILFHCYNDQI